MASDVSCLIACRRLRAAQLRRNVGCLSLKKKETWSKRILLFTRLSCLLKPRGQLQVRTSRICFPLSSASSSSQAPRFHLFHRRMESQRVHIRKSKTDG